MGPHSRLDRGKQEIEPSSAPCHNRDDEKHYHDAPVLFGAPCRFLGFLFRRLDRGFPQFENGLVGRH